MGGVEVMSVCSDRAPIWGIPSVPVAKTTQMRVTLRWPCLGSRTKLTGPRAVAGSSTWRWHSSIGLAPS